MAETHSEFETQRDYLLAVAYRMLSYTNAYAPDSELPGDELLALAGWAPTLTAAQASSLTEAAAGGVTREQFVHALHNETGLGNAWVDGLLSLDSTTSNENGSPQ